MALSGKVVPVGLDLSETHLKFNFEETNLEMSTTRKVVLSNNGNGKAFFKFLSGKEKLFLPAITEGEILPGTNLTVVISFTAPFSNTLKN